MESDSCAIVFHRCLERWFHVWWRNMFARFGALMQQEVQRPAQEHDNCSCNSHSWPPARWRSCMTRPDDGLDVFCKLAMSLGLSCRRPRQIPLDLWVEDWPN